MTDDSEHAKKINASIQLIERLADAHVAILAGVAMDQNLERALLTKMRPLARDMKDRLFDGYGPIANFAGKIDIAYALEIIPEDIYKYLRTINKLRVKFAHPTQPFINFQDPEIAVILAKLPGINATIPDIKMRFLMKVKEIGIHLDDIYVQHCKATGQTPTDVDASLLS